VVVYNWTLTN